MNSNNVHKVINSEIGQGPESRTSLFAEIENELNGRAVVSYFTSFVHNASVHDDDCDMLQSVLQEMDTSKGIALIISTPGGDGLAAERIANICRTYSGTGEFWAIVPGKAKSAGTIVTMGASKIIMAGSSELGPVDPQIFRTENGVRKFFSADALVASYDQLMREVSSAKDSPLEPYLLQLQKHDHREITQYRTLIDLAKSISVKLLKSGMMSALTEQEIEERIGIFLNPKAGTLSHGRAIYAHEAEESGLTIERLDVRSDLWAKLYELYARTDGFVSMRACKAVESREESFYVSTPNLVSG